MSPVAGPSRLRSSSLQLDSQIMLPPQAGTTKVSPVDKTSPKMSFLPRTVPLQNRSVTESISHRLRLASPLDPDSGTPTPLYSPDLPSSDPSARLSDAIDPFFPPASFGGYPRRDSDQTDTLTTPDLEPLPALYSFGGPAKGEGDVAFGARVRKEFPFPAVNLAGSPAYHDTIRMLGRMHRGSVGSPPGSPLYEGGPVLTSPFASPDPSTFQGGSPRLGGTADFGSVTQKANSPEVPFARGPDSPDAVDSPRCAPVASGLYGHARPDEAQQAAKDGQKAYHEQHHAGGVAVKNAFASDDAGGFMGNGSFGTAIRGKVAEVLERMCATVPHAVKAANGKARAIELDDEEEDDDEDTGEVVSIVEYDAVGSQSAALIKPIIETLERRPHRPRFADLALSASFETVKRSTTDRDARRHSRSSTSSSYLVTHASPPSTDTRPLSLLSESSYLDYKWQAQQSPSLVDAVFASYTNKTFGEATVPRGTVSVGFSIMEMQKAFTARARGMSESQHADAEFRAFLRARATEFRRGGSLVLAFAVGREKDTPPPPRPPFNRAVSYDAETASSPPLTRRGSLPPSPTRGTFEADQPCLWQQLERIVAFSIRSLVTQGLIKPVVASAMEKLPLHARTARQMRELLHSVKDDWKIEWSCGLGRDPENIGAHSSSTARPLDPSAVETVEGPLRLTHPAQTAYENGAIGPSVWAEHAVALIRACYESHCRHVLVRSALNGPAGMDRGRAEHVLEALWEDLEMRVAGGALEGAQLEVAVVGLRRL